MTTGRMIALVLLVATILAVIAWGILVYVLVMGGSQPDVIYP